MIIVSDFIQFISTHNDELLEQKSEEKSDFSRIFLQKSRCKVSRAILAWGCLAGLSSGMAPSCPELSRRLRHPQRCLWSRTLRWGDRYPQKSSLGSPCPKMYEYLKMFSLVRVNWSRCRRLLFGAIRGSVWPGSWSLRYVENIFHLELFTENGAVQIGAKHLNGAGFLLL